MNKNSVLMMFLVFVLPLLLSAGDSLKTEIRIGNTVFEFDTDDTTLSEDNLKTFKEVIVTIENIVDKITGKRTKKELSSKIDSIYVTRSDIQRERPKHERSFRIFKKNKKAGIYYLAMDINNYPYTIHWGHDVSKLPKFDDLKKLQDEHADIAGYPVFPESTAVLYAKEFISQLNGNESAAMFDSVSFNYCAKFDINMQYQICFYIKPKNDINDPTKAMVRINAFTGEFTEYEGRLPVLSKDDFNYIPKITKDQALAIHADKCKKLQGSIKYSTVELMKRYLRDSRWHWRIHASNTDGKKTRPAIVYIDSENGEIIYKTNNME